MTNSLRPYQEIALQTAKIRLRTTSENGILVLPTGSGKSLVIAALADWASDWYQVLVLANRKELIQQNAAKFPRPERVGIYSASVGTKDLSRPIICGQIQSIYQTELPVAPKLIVIDECDLVSNAKEGMYHELLARYPDARVIGLTATPYRMKEGLLTWGRIWHDTTYKELISLGFLTPIVYDERTTIDVSKIPIERGEYVTSDAEKAYTEQACLDAIIRYTKAYLHAGRRKILINCVSQRHADMVASWGAANGLRILPITSNTPDDDRAWAVARFSELDSGINVLAHVGIFLRGSDFPYLDCIINARPTKSLALLIQALGRLTRLADGKVNGLFADFAGVIKELGGIEQASWKRLAGKEVSRIHYQICCNCERIYEKKVLVCENCNWVFPPSEAVEHTIEHALKPAEITKTYKPTSIEVKKHRKKDGEYDTLKMTIHCGYDSFTDWLALSHPMGSAGRRFAEAKCRKFGVAPPDSVDKALEVKWPLPKSITVKVAGKYPEIINIDMLGEQEQQKELSLG